MDEQGFLLRTKQLDLNVMRMADGLPKSRSGDVIARQVIRSATSVGANYRAACRAKSTADMIVKLKNVEEEADETMYWLEMMIEVGNMKQDGIGNLRREAEEILRMTVASIKTLRERSSPRMS